MANKLLALEFKVTLEEIEPPIWRRVRVPAKATMWDLHVAIQDAMGWWDSHLHEFTVQDASGTRHIGIPTEDIDWKEVEPGWMLPAKQAFPEPGATARYEYDFGDGWVHTVVLEQMVTTGKAIMKPRCIAGERACPPEDCGGPPGYLELLEALLHPSHPEHAAMKEWAPDGFDSEQFSHKSVVFADPRARLHAMME